jgi:hypothetical protein
LFHGYARSQQKYTPCLKYCRGNSINAKAILERIILRREAVFFYGRKFPKESVRIVNKTFSFAASQNYPEWNTAVISTLTFSEEEVNFF